MGQQISNCKTGTEPSHGSFEPHIVECRKRRLPGAAPKSLLQHFHNNDDNTAMSRTTASTCTGQTSANSKSTSSSFSPPSPLGSSSGTLGGKNSSNRSSNFNIIQTRPNLLHLPTKDMYYQQDQDQETLALRYRPSTSNLSKEAAATTASKTNATISTDNDPDSRPILQQQQQHQEEKQQRQEDTRGQRSSRNHRRKGQSQSFQGNSQGSDKRSTPVKFPRKRHTTYGRPTRNPEQQRNDAVAAQLTANNGSPQHPNNETPQGASYLERMYDARTWDMYQRITTHREKVEAFNAANVSAKEQRKNEHDDDRNSTNNQTYMSDLVQRTTNSTAMVGGVDYDNFYELDDDDFLLEDHSAPPYHHHRQCDNGQHHHQSGFYCHNPGGHRHNNHHNSNHNHHSSNTETYSEWEHMYGDDVEAVGDPVNDSINAHGGHHETIFLFDF